MKLPFISPEQFFAATPLSAPLFETIATVINRRQH
jgi:hypothetical protein